MRWDKKNAVRVPDQELRLREIARYITQMFARRPEVARRVEWLRKVEVKRLPSLWEAYTVPGLVPRARPRAAHVIFEDDAPKTLCIPRFGPSSFYGEIARLILESSFGGPAYLA